VSYYFGTEGKYSLKFFGLTHIILILITIISIFLIYKYKNKLRNYKNIKYIIVGILFLNMIIYILGAVFAGIFNIQEHLPIHYCYITGFMFMYMILKEKKNWFNFLYYAIFFCTITVIIFKDPNITYDRYEFILLFISHHFLLISSFYTLYVLKYPVDKYGYKSFAIYSAIVYLIVFMINRFLGTDYIFNTSFPDFIYEYFPFVKLLPPLIWFILLSIPLLSLAYIPIKKLTNNKKEI